MGFKTYLVLCFVILPTLQENGDSFEEETLSPDQAAIVEKAKNSEVKIQLENAFKKSQHFEKKNELLSFQNAALEKSQVHKVVLNQRVTSTLSLQPLQSSRTSWCWFGMNLPEQESEPVLEKLAAKFKTEAQATAFYDAVQESLFDIGTVQNEESATSGQKFNESSDADDDDDDRDYGEGNYDDREYEDGDDEYEPDYYVDEEAIGDAMDELEVEGLKEILFESDVHVEVLEGNSSVDYDGVIKLVKKYDEDKEDNIGCVVFSTAEVPALYKADIVEGMNAVNEGNGTVAFVELNSDDYERKIVLQFENEDVAEEFAVSFRSLNIPACPKTH